MRHAVTHYPHGLRGLVDSQIETQDEAPCPCGPEGLRLPQHVASAFSKTTAAIGPPVRPHRVTRSYPITVGKGAAANREEAQRYTKVRTLKMLRGAWGALPPTPLPAVVIPTASPTPTRMRTPRRSRRPSTAEPVIAGGRSATCALPLPTHRLDLPPTGGHPRCGREPTWRESEWGSRRRGTGHAVGSVGCLPWPLRQRGAYAERSPNRDGRRDA
jgi:hypothetical protein